MDEWVDGWMNGWIDGWMGEPETSVSKLDVYPENPRRRVGYREGQASALEEPIRNVIIYRPLWGLQ